MVKRNYFLLIGFGLLIFVLTGCGTASKQQYPYMYGVGDVQSENKAVVLRPVEFGVNDLGPVRAEAYEVRRRTGLLKLLLGAHVEGDMPFETSSVTSVFSGLEGDLRGLNQSAQPLSKIAIQRAIKSVPGAEALYLTNMEKSTQKTFFTEKISIAVEGRALSYKSEGTISPERWDERKNQKLIINSFRK